MTARHDDWEERLGEYVSAKVGKSFRWGSTDCGSLVRGAAKAMCNGARNQLGPVQPYRSRTAAVKSLEHIGAPSAHLEASDAVSVPLQFAQPGDILIMPGDDEYGLPRLGVALGAGRLLSSLPGHGVYLGRLNGCPPETIAWRLPA